MNQFTSKYGLGDVLTFCDVKEIITAVLFNLGERPKYQLSKILDGEVKSIIMTEAEIDLWITQNRMVISGLKQQK